jgi:hypothetical protein
MTNVYVFVCLGSDCVGGGRVSRRMGGGSFPADLSSNLATQLLSSRRVISGRRFPPPWTVVEEARRASRITAPGPGARAAAVGRRRGLSRTGHCLGRMRGPIGGRPCGSGAGSASALSLSRPAQASLTLRPAGSLSRLSDLCHKAPALPVTRPSRSSASGSIDTSPAEPGVITLPMAACPPSFTCTCSTRTSCCPPVRRRRRTSICIAYAFIKRAAVDPKAAIRRSVPKPLSIFTSTDIAAAWVQAI